MAGGYIFQKNKNTFPDWQKFYSEIFEVSGFRSSSEIQEFFFKIFLLYSFLKPLNFQENRYLHYPRLSRPPPAWAAITGGSRGVGLFSPKSQNQSRLYL